MKKNGFTLAEVLITLTIIGVIAAITIPNLIKKWENHANYSALEKNYAILQNAYKLIEKEYGSFSYYSEPNAGAIFGERLAQYIKTTKICEGTGDKLKDQCFNYDVDALNTTSSITIELPHYAVRSANEAKSFVLSDGTRMFVRYLPDGNITVYSGIGHINAIVFYVDVNGKKGPNRFGKDVFVFYLPAEGSQIYPAGYKKISNPASYSILGYGAQGACDSSVSVVTNGTGCAARALYVNHNLNY